MLLSVNLFSENEVKPLNALPDSSLSVKDRSEILTAVFNHKLLLQFFDRYKSYGLKNYRIEAGADSDFELNVQSKDKKFEIVPGSNRLFVWHISWFYKDDTIVVHVNWDDDDGDYFYAAYEMNKMDGVWIINEDTVYFEWAMV